MASETASRLLKGARGGGSSKMEGIDGRVDGDEGSVARRADPSTQSLIPLATLDICDFHAHID